MKLRNISLIILIVFISLGLTSDQFNHFNQYLYKNDDNRSSEGYYRLNKLLPLRSLSTCGMEQQSSNSQKDDDYPGDWSPRYDIIDGGPTTRYPGDEITIATQFKYESGGDIFPISGQKIYIYLNNSPINLDNLGQTELESHSNYIGNDVVYIGNNGQYTNGTDIEVPYGLYDDAENTPSKAGWISFRYTIPSTTELQDNFGISPGDTVTIYQYYPSGNDTTHIADSPPLDYVDTFTLREYAEIPNPSSPVSEIHGDNTFRPGENATFTIEALVGSSPVSSVSVDFVLKYQNGTVITDPNSIGISIDYGAGFSSFVTNSSGKLDIIIRTTSGVTPQADYNLTFTGDFSAAGEITRSGTTDDAYVLFSVQEIMDTGSISFVSAVPGTTLYPRGNPNETIVTYRVEIADNYRAQGTYYLAGIPVKLTLTGGTVGITYYNHPDFTTNGSSEWLLTNSTGYVSFVVNTSFPSQFLEKTVTVSAQAAFESSDSPVYDSNYYPTNNHRFIRSSTGTNTVTSSQTSISIDPDFNVCSVTFFGTNATGNSVRPGETINVTFIVKDQSNNPVGDVPVNITITENIDGVYIKSVSPSNPLFVSGYYNTTAQGTISVNVKTTYLVTPEVYDRIPFHVVTDLQNDSSIDHIGSEHQGTDTWDNYKITWSTVDLTATNSQVVIDPDFNEATIRFLSCNDSDRKIRPGDNVTIDFIVEDETGTPLENIPVNISLVSSYAGVTIKVLNTTANPSTTGVPGYYNTSTAGKITILLNTSYTQTPKNLFIYLNARANLTNVVYYNGTEYDLWLVGKDSSITPQFRTINSYSDLSSSLQIEVDPQYFTGQVTLANIANNPNATKVSQTETIKLVYDVTLTSGTSTLNGIRVWLVVNGTNPSYWNMSVVDGNIKYTSNGRVTYEVITNASGNLTPEEKIYNFTLIADFENDTTMIYNITHSSVPTGKLYGVWVNGSDSDNWDSLSQFIEVKNQEKTTVTVFSVSDSSHSDVGLVDNYWEVYRTTTTITIEGSYKDITLDPVVGQEVVIKYNDSQNQNVALTTTTTNSTGEFRVDVTLPSSTKLEDIVIYADDVSTTDEGHVGYDKVRVITTIDLSDLTITFNNGNHGEYVRVGENITISGSVKDDTGNYIVSSELDGLFRLAGWNGTHEIGQIVVDDVTTGSYSYNYRIPWSYNYTYFYIRINITDSVNLVHYRSSFVQGLVKTYRETSISIDVWVESYYLGKYTDNSTIIVSGVTNQTLTIVLTLDNTSGTSLADKNVTITWGSNYSEGVRTNNSGKYEYSYQITADLPSESEYENLTISWTGIHYTDNGTTVNPLYNLTFVWVVRDTTAPTLDITAPSTFTNDTVYGNINSLTFTAAVTDPSRSDGYVSVGINNSDTSAVVIIINGTTYSMTNIGSGVYQYIWDTSGVEDKYYVIQIVAKDLANNVNSSEPVRIVIDKVSPKIELVSFENNTNGYVVIDSQGYVNITGKITEKASSTGLDTVIDTAECWLVIKNSSSSNPVINVSLSLESLNNGSYTFIYRWKLASDMDNLKKVSRVLPFNSTDKWKIIISIKDQAGNSAENITTAIIDNISPIEVPSTVYIPNVVSSAIFDVSTNNTLVVELTVVDSESNINQEQYIFTLNQTTESSYISAYSVENSTAVVNGKTQVKFKITFILNQSVVGSSLFADLYVIDNAGNPLNVRSTEFLVIDSSTTTTTTAITTDIGNTTMETSTSINVGTIDLIPALILNIVAFGLGVGIAALVERIKYARSK